MTKKKTLMIRSVGQRRALLAYRKMVIRNVLMTMYNTKDIKQFYDAEVILYRECRKAHYENWLRIRGAIMEEGRKDNK